MRGAAGAVACGAAERADAIADAVGAVVEPLASSMIARSRGASAAAEIGSLGTLGLSTGELGDAATAGATDCTCGLRANVTPTAAPATRTAAMIPNARRRPPRGTWSLEARWNDSSLALDLRGPVCASASGEASAWATASGVDVS